MSTNAKIGIAAAALVALVFVVTIVAQLPRGGDKQPGDDPTGPGGESATNLTGVTVDLGYARYEPNGRRAVLRECQQFYEEGEYLVPFWVSNRTAVPLTLTFKETSCGACSFAEVAVLDTPPTIDGTGDPDPFGAVCGGVMGKMPTDEQGIQPLGLDQMEYLERKRLVDAVPADRWQRLKAPNSSRPNVGEVKEVVIPPGEKGKPTWAVVRLNVSLSQSKELLATFQATRPDTPAPIPFRLVAVVTLVEPCNISPEKIDFGVVQAGTDPRPQTVYFWSHTRTTAPGSPTPLSLPVRPSAARHPHLRLSDPVPATDGELAELAARMSTPTQGVRVAGAYKMTLSFTRAAADGKSPDAPIGPSQRSLEFAADGGKQPKVAPKLSVSTFLLGPVRLENADRIDLQTYEVREGLDVRFTVSAEDPDAVLEWVKEDTTPSFLEVGEPTKEKKGGRMYWTFPLSIAKNVGGDVPPGSVVVLRIKGTGQLVRLPVIGSGRS